MVHQHIVRKSDQVHRRQMCDRRHTLKHGTGWRPQPQEWQRFFFELRNSTWVLRKSRGRKHYYYNLVTGLFVVLQEGSGRSTAFVPSAGEAYYHRQ